MNTQPMIMGIAQTILLNLFYRKVEPKIKLTNREIFQLIKDRIMNLFPYT